MKNALILLLVIIFGISCEKDNSTDNSEIISSFDMSLNECKTSIGQSKICFDSILTDSRCPQGAYCVWEGNAKLRFSMTLQGNKNLSFNLNTNTDFTIDTIIDNVYLLLTDFTPFPKIGNVINSKDYKAKLIIANIDRLESNAKIIGFNPDKCSCCWGWTIKIGNDTIKSDDEIIGKTIGYKSDYPVNIYIEIGDLTQTCSETGGYDYYKLKTMIKMK